MAECKQADPAPCRRNANRTLVTLKVGNLPGRVYYFPRTPSGVGIVEVRIAAPDGTIVVTGGMNGCSVEVIQRGSTLVFYHDADGCQMRNTVSVDGSTSSGAITRNMPHTISDTKR
jgi:hypothetical protein